MFSRFYYVQIAKCVLSLQQALIRWNAGMMMMQVRLINKITSLLTAAGGMTQFFPVAQRN